VESPFLGAFYRDLLSRALCSPMQGGAARAARTLRFRRRDCGAWGCTGHALCSCPTQSRRVVTVRARIIRRGVAAIRRDEVEPPRESTCPGQQQSVAAVRSCDRLSITGHFSRFGGQTGHEAERRVNVRCVTPLGVLTASTSKRSSSPSSPSQSRTPRPRTIGAITTCT
jgi:hypothetical protein